MASTYDQIRGGTAKQVNFARGEQTFSLSHRDAIIPPPLNVIVFAFSVLWFAMEFCVWLLTCGHYILNIESLLPIRIDYDHSHKIFSKVEQTTTARYCQFCRYYMRRNGDISHYFKLFVNYRLDVSDL
eukprot:14421_1